MPDGGVAEAEAYATPIAPPGWNIRKTSAGLLSGVVCSLLAVARASASPTASATVVDEVGAGNLKDTSSDS
jgi:hypothetical protein